jgi:hypothetical protein
MTPEEKKSIVQAAIADGMKAAQEVLEQLNLNDFEKTWARAKGAEAANFISRKYTEDISGQLEYLSDRLRRRAVTAALAYALQFEETIERRLEAGGVSKS